MTEKDIKDYCKNCSVEPPAMRFKCPECEHNTENENFAKDINVPHKEQIIIDGVDVSRCKFFNDITESYYCFGIPCKDRPNCYFKQLARKTQECEELKKANQHIDTNRQCKGSKLKRIEELISDCETGYTDEFIQKIYGIIQEPEPTVNDYSITDRYRKALEEIEDFRKKHCDFWCEGNRILDIINKAKGD